MSAEDEPAGASTSEHVPRIAKAEDARAAAILLDAFNTEFGVETPGPDFLERRLSTLIADSETEVFLGGAGPDAVLVMCIRPALWADGSDAYIEELYVRPERRRRGIGEALMRFALESARASGGVRVELGTDEGDEAAHALYEKLGFTNFAGEDTREQMLFYEREL